MPTESGDPAGHAHELQGAVEDVLADFPDADLAAALGAVDDRWLSFGLRLGLERPEQARHLLELIGAQEAGPSALREAEAGGVAVAGGTATEDPTPDAPMVPAPVPARSSLLARSAALPSSDWASMGPDVVFGWAAMLTADELLSIGRFVQDMLAAGSPPDIGRGFGLAWQAGVRLPHHEVEAMFREFTELEITVGGVLAGRDLRMTGEPAPRPQGLGGLFESWMPRKNPVQSQAAATFERNGEPGQRGLVALWNAWVAVRYRTLLPPPTFELLVRPWVTIVGPLPEP